MSYIVEWDDDALNSLRKLPRDVVKRIVSKVQLSKEDPKHFMQKLVGEDYYKIRIGDYRAIVDLIESDKKIVVRVVGHRKKIYNKI